MDFILIKQPRPDHPGGFDQQIMARRHHDTPVDILRHPPDHDRRRQIFAIQVAQEILRRRQQFFRQPVQIRELVIRQDRAVFADDRARNGRSGFLQHDPFRIQQTAFFGFFDRLDLFPVGRQTEYRAAGQQQGAFAARFPGEFEYLAGKQVIESIGIERSRIDVPADRGAAAGIQIDGDQDGIAAVGVGPSEQQTVVRMAVDESRRRAVVETGHFGEDRIEPADVSHLVFGRTPVKGGIFMHVDPFAGEPFHAVGESECAVGRGQSGQRGAHFRIFVRGCGQPEIVMRFRVMDHEAVPRALLPGIIQISFDLPAGVILEQFGIRPVHIGIIEQFRGHRRIAAETFQQKDRFREFLADLRHNVFPRRHGDHVGGITPETVHPAHAPVTERARQIFPQFEFGMVQLGQVTPGNTPRAGRMDRAVGIAHQPFGMRLMQFGCPAGMVDRDVNENLAAFHVDGIDQFAELVQRRRFPVELRQLRIDSGKIQRGIRTPETSHATINGRPRMDRQQVQDPAVQIIENMVQLFDQIAESAGRRNDAVAKLVQMLQFLPADPGRQIGNRLVLVAAELPDERAVNPVGAAVGSRLHIDMDIVAGDPERLFHRLGIVDEAFPLEMPFFGQHQTDLPVEVVDLLHREIVPVLKTGRDLIFHVLNDLLPVIGRIAEIRAQKRFAADRVRTLQPEFQNISAMQQQMGPRTGMLSQFRHDPVSPSAFSLLFRRFRGKERDLAVFDLHPAGEIDRVTHGGMPEREAPVDRDSEFRSEFIHHGLDFRRSPAAQEMAVDHARRALEKFPVQQRLEILTHFFRRGIHDFDENDPPRHRRTVIGLGNPCQTAQQSGKCHPGTIAADHLFDRDRSDRFAVVHRFHLIDAALLQTRHGSAHRSRDRTAVTFRQHGRGNLGDVAVALQIQVVAFFQFVPVQSRQQFAASPAPADAQDHIDFRIVPCCIEIGQPSLDRCSLLALHRLGESMGHDLDFISGLFQQNQSAAV